MQPRDIIPPTTRLVDATTDDVARIVAAHIAPVLAELASLRDELARVQPAAPAEPAPEKLYMSCDEYAARYGVSLRTVREWIHSGLPSVRVGRRRRVAVRQADMWLAQRSAERVGGSR